MRVEVLLDQMQADPDGEALIHNDRVYTFGELSKLGQTWTRAISDHQLESGAVVGITGDYSPDAIALVIALIRNRNIIVPVNPIPGVDISKYWGIANVHHVIELTEAGFNITKLDTAPPTHPILVNLLENDHPGLILFTSGSTGEPKAVVHDFDKLLSKFASSKKKLRTLCFLMFDHIAGIDTYFYCLFSGSTAIFTSDRSPEGICRIIERHKVEVLPASPTFLNLLLLSEEYKNHDLSALKIITFGSERMSESALKKLMEVFPNVKILQKYGVTELGSPASKSNPEDPIWIKMNSETFQTKVMDGILYVKADTAMLGYLNAPSPFTDDGWYNTGDAVEVDGEYIKILGRASELINVGGEKVYPAEVENVIEEMDNVVEVSVLGVPNPITGNVVCAKVRLNEPENKKEFAQRLKKYVGSKLERYKVPVKVQIVDESLHSVRFKKIRK